ncbi:MAG TPA: Sbal_3080 family lipoprotein [Candidatus Limnocylindria bacterium]|nr:Sbal_3080 family lipoprotein [Candidatus Limnocylindria bacterium]
MNVRAAALVLGILASGCTVRHASPLAQRPDRLCIQRNPAVIIEDFLPTLQAVLRERGVQSAVYDGDAAPASCAYVLTYTARRGWDIVSYLKLIELTVMRRDGTMVGHAEWRHRGGFGFNKWAGSRGKIERAVNDLLATG